MLEMVNVVFISIDANLHWLLHYCSLLLDSEFAHSRSATAASEALPIRERPVSAARTR